MITQALQITVYVEDVDEAKTFYTETLGFVVRSDEEFTEGWRYLTVAPSENSETVLELQQADTPEKTALIGKQAADHPLIMFASDDIEQDYQAMKAKGVVFPAGEPKSVPGGKGAPFDDLYGNKFDLYQQKKN